MDKKKIEIKVTVDAKDLQDALDTPVLTENQQLAEELPPDPPKDPEEERVKDEEWKKEPVKVGDKVPSQALVSTVFDFICNRRFLFCMDGLDAFLVKKVERPPYIKPKKHSVSASSPFAEQENQSHKKLVVYLHDAISPSTRQQVEELLNITAFPLVAQVKLLDPVGTVIGLYTYSGVEVERVDYDPLDYNDNRPNAEIKLTLSYKKERMDY